MRRALDQAAQALQAQAREPDAKPGVTAALADLQRGDPAKAEAIFRDVLESKSAEGAAANREAAAAARHLAALTLLHDRQRALDYSKRAVDLDPTSIEAWLLRGLVLDRARELAAARAAYQQALDLDPADPRQRSVALTGLGDVAVFLDRVDAAERFYQEALGIIEAAARASPGDPGAQRDPSVSLNKIGDVRVATGDRTGALEAYEQGRAIAETLAARDPTNAEWQRDLSVSYERIGDVRVAQGDRAGALEAYEQGRAIAETLAARDPANAEWQRDLIVSNVKLAQVAQQDGRAAEARRHYGAALAVAKALQESGRLAPVDAWMIGDLEARLAALAEGSATSQ